MSLEAQRILLGVSFKTIGPLMVFFGILNIPLAVTDHMFYKDYESASTEFMWALGLTIGGVGLFKFGNDVVLPRQ